MAYKDGDRVRSGELTNQASGVHSQREQLCRYIDLGPPSLQGDDTTHLCYFKPPSCGILLSITGKMNTTADKVFHHFSSLVSLWAGSWWCTSAEQSMEYLTEMWVWWEEATPCHAGPRGRLDHFQASRAQGGNVTLGVPPGQELRQHTHHT